MKYLKTCKKRTLPTYLDNALSVSKTTFVFLKTRRQNAFPCHHFRSNALFFQILLM